MCEYMINMGGIEFYENLADQKSSELYKFLDDSHSEDTSYFYNSVDERLRSRMNIPFNICDFNKEVSTEKE